MPTPDVRWVIDLYFDFYLDQSMFQDLAKAIGDVEGFDDVRVRHRGPHRYLSVELKRTTSYSVVAMATPREIVEAAHRLDIPLMNNQIIAVVIKEVGRAV